MKKILMAIASAALACGIGFAAVGCGSNGDISVYNREDGSGTRDAFLELLGIESDELNTGVAQLNSTSAVIQGVAGDEKAIGYASLGSVDSTVKALSVDGVTPTEEMVADGSYKVSRPFELMYDETALAENDLLSEFIEYLKSAEAQTVIAAEGYVSVVENAPTYTVPTADLSVTEIEASGSTSVGPLMTKLAADFSAKVEEATGQEVQVTVSGGGSGQGIKDANEGNTEIGMASKEVVDGEDVTNEDVTIYQLCADGIAVIVNKANPATDISLENLKKIYTDKSLNWIDIGVEFPEEE